MSRFRRLSHTIPYSEHHVVWVPKYSFSLLQGALKEGAKPGIQGLSAYAGCGVVELNVQPDPVLLMVMIPPKLSISELVARLKGQTSMTLFHHFRPLKRKPYWGKAFWAKNYCVDTVTLDADMIHYYARYQEKNEQQMEQLRLSN